jgi:hypothetical protein
VPYSKYDDFLKEYALYTLETEDPCLALAEAHGPKFKMFMDVDLKLLNPECIVAQGAAGGSPPVLTDAGRRLLHTIYVAVAGGTGKIAEMIVCMAEPYDLGGGLHKVGFHLHWPDIVVGQEEAVKICIEHCVPACQAELNGLADWASVFDGSVYRSGACLRLIGCIKGDPRRSKATFYKPAYTMAAKEELQPVRRPFLFPNLVHWLQRTSIHVEEPDTAPDEYRALSCSPAGGGGRLIAPSQYADLVEAVRECMFDPTFKQTPVSKVTLYPPPDPPKPLGRRKQAPLPKLGPSVVLSLNSTRCLNLLGRTHHRNNHTYLVVNHNGIFQKCHNKNPSGNGRRYCDCARFSHKVGELDAKGKLRALVREAWLRVKP